MIYLQSFAELAAFDNRVLAHDAEITVRSVERVYVYKSDSRYRVDADTILPTATGVGRYHRRAWPE